MRHAPTCSCAADDRRIPPFVLDNPVRRLFQPPRRFLRGHLRTGDRAADLGCGPGHYTVAMTAIVGRRGRVHAVDLDPRALARLRRKLARHGVGDIVETHVASAADIDFIASGSVDFVLAEGLLCCMKDHAGAMRQIERILSPHGKAWLSVMKLARPGDPLSVTTTEWASLLDRMRVHDAREGLLSRWALVGPPHPRP